MSEPTGMVTTTSPVSQRFAYLDNARYWVMLLVVIGHFLTRLRGIDSGHGIYTWIYSFHMPFFVLISGYTARRYVGDLRQIKRMVSSLIVPYAVVETTLQLITIHFENSPKHLQVLSPQWLAWFIAALVLWRLTTPIWRALRYPIITSIVLSLGAGLVDIPNMALAKGLGFLPFYVVGLHMSRERFNRLADTRIRIASAVILAGSLVLALLYSSGWKTTWLLFDENYTSKSLDVSLTDGLITRAALLIVAFTLTFAALSLIPRRRTWTSRLGERTIYTYLLHGYVILALDFGLGFWDQIKPYQTWAVLACVVLAVFLANLLMTRPFEIAFRPIFQPRLRWLFRRSDTPSMPASTGPPGSARSGER